MIHKFPCDLKMENLAASTIYENRSKIIYRLKPQYVSYKRRPLFYRPYMIRANFITARIKCLQNSINMNFICPVAESGFRAS